MRSRFSGTSPGLLIALLFNIVKDRSESETRRANATTCIMIASASWDSDLNMLTPNTYKGQAGAGPKIDPQTLNEAQV